MVLCILQLVWVPPHPKETVLNRPCLFEGHPLCEEHGLGAHRFPTRRSSKQYPWRLPVSNNRSIHARLNHAVYLLPSSGLFIIFVPESSRHDVGACVSIGAGQEMVTPREEGGHICPEVLEPLFTCCRRFGIGRAVGMVIV